MERYKAAIILPIIEAFSKGELIELKYHDSDLWEETNTLDVDSDICIYRVKPKPKLVPFTFEDKELLVDKWVVEKGYTAIDKIIRIANDGVLAGNKAIMYSKLFHSYEFSDGSPCGKYINE